MDEFRLQLCSKEDAQRVHTMEEQVKAILQQNERLKETTERQSHLLKRKDFVMRGMRSEMHDMAAEFVQNIQRCTLAMLQRITRVKTIS